jgi:hypothetical protein
MAADLYYLHFADAGNRVTLTWKVKPYLTLLFMDYIFMPYWEWLGTQYGTQFWDPQYGPQIWTPILDPHLDPQYWPPIWTPNMDPQYGPPIWDPDLDPKYEPPFWTPNMDPRLASYYFPLIYFAATIFFFFLTFSQSFTTLCNIDQTQNEWNVSEVYLCAYA